MGRAAAIDGCETSGWWRPTLAGFCASLVGIGLARFAYTPLIPAIISGGWFAPSAAAYLGAANLVGYLAGALLARRLVAVAPAAVALRALMVVATVAFFACALPLSFVWFFAWRFLSGAAGGGLMALAAPTVLPHVPPSRRGLAGGIIFTGVGVGIIASGTLVPLLLRVGLAPAWCGLGAVAVVLTLVAWRAWPDDPVRAGPPAAGTNASDASALSSPLLWALYIAYALNAAGLVPHMVFLVDFIARGLGAGLDIGAGYWVLFGLGAAIGPVLTGSLGDRIGFGPAFRVAFVVQALAIGLLTMTQSTAALAVSSILIGAFVPGVVPLALGRVHELLPPEGPSRRIAWGYSTSAFALGQAAGAYGLSFVFARTGDYLLLFSLGVGLVILGLAVDLATVIMGWRPRPASAARPR